jgi:hypothetical protein
MRRFLAIAALCTLLGGCEQATVETHTDPVVVTAQVERAQVTPGRPFELSVEINRRDDVEFRLPDLGAGIQGLVIMELREEGPESAAGRVLSRTIYKLKAPLSGTYLIPGAEGAWTARDGETGRAGSGPILIEAAHAAGEEGSGTSELRDIKAARAPRIHWPPFVLAGLLALLLLTAVLLVRRARRGELPVPQRSAREIALGELDKLRRPQRLGATDQGPFAYEVSAILRRYLEAVFGFPAWRMTTAELLRAMPRELLDRRKVEVAIREVLEASDLVKFAGEQVPEAVLQLWVDQAAGVVRDTAPSPTEDESGSAAEAGP